MTENKDWEMYEHLKSRKISVREHYVSALIGMSPFFLTIVGGMNSIAKNTIALNLTFIAVALVFLVLPALFICWSFKELHRRLQKQYQQPLLYGNEEVMHYGKHVFVR